MQRPQDRTLTPVPTRDPEIPAGDQAVILAAVRRLLHEGSGLMSVRAAAEVTARATHDALGTEQALACLLEGRGTCRSGPTAIPVHAPTPVWGPGILVEADWPLWARLGEADHPVLVPDTAGSSLVPPAVAQRLRWGALAALPLRRGEGPLVGAVVCAHAGPHRWTTTEQSLLHHLLQESALVVAHAALREEDRRSMAALRRQSLHDPLTGLANRTLLFDRLEQATRVGARSGTSLGVVFVDLDDFKRINDTLGHDAGDRVLVQVARALRDCLREADTIARFAGDEFVVLLRDTSPEEAVAVAERVAQRLCPQPLRPDDRDGRALGEVTASVGVATGTVGPGRGELLLRRADQAMYRAKQSGERVGVYEPDRDGAILERDHLEGELRHALPADQLRLVYQPVVDLASGRVLGAEALLRWQHPRLGLLTPDRFLALAEQTELMVPLGRWILDTGCRQLARWNDGTLARPPLNLAVNISAVQLHRGERFLEDLRGVLDRWGTDPRRLILEITETALLPDAHIPALLDELRAMGLTIALDDFGVGYSSLRYLQRLPLDIIKIDRSFIADMEEQESSRALVAAVVSLGETLGLDVVAEGIETTCQRDHLRSIACPFGQGYLFAPPLDPAELEALLTGEEPSAPEGDPSLIDIVGLPAGGRR